MEKYIYHARFPPNKHVSPERLPSPVGEKPAILVRVLQRNRTKMRYIYIHRERERERERGGQSERESKQERFILRN